jgi:hypothetical protein
MKNVKVLLIVTQLFVVNVLVAQNLSESLGGTKTNFQIVSDTVDLQVSNQIIILRAEGKHYANFIDSFGYGYGYQSFHLEFIAKKNIKAEAFKFVRGQDNKDKLELIFYDSENNVLALKSVPIESVDILSNSTTSDGLFFYSLDLIEIPIILLEKTCKINMIKKVLGKK